MFMCVVNLESVNKLDLTWKQSFLILVDSELFGRRSLYQFEKLSEETHQTTLLPKIQPSETLQIKVNIRSKHDDGQHDSSQSRHHR